MPHALIAASTRLTTALDKNLPRPEMGRPEIKAQPYTNGQCICDGIERFVATLTEVPGGHEELRRRANLVEAHCATGSAFANARDRALPSYRGQPFVIRKRGSGALKRIRNSVDYAAPIWLDDIDRLHRDIEAVLKESRLNLSNEAKTAYIDWLDACKAVQRKADPLEVDGCRRLFLIHQATEESPSEGETDASYARDEMRSAAGLVHMEPIKAATDSMMAWAGESAIGQLAPVASAGAPEIAEEATDAPPRRRTRRRAASGGAPPKYPSELYRDARKAWKQYLKELELFGGPPEKQDTWLYHDWLPRWCKTKDFSIDEVLPESFPGDTWEERAHRFWDAERQSRRPRKRDKP